MGLIDCYNLVTSGRQVKSEGAWSPNAQQREEIEKGLEVNSRGARSKSLRKTAQQGYRSSGSMRRDSVSVIGYSETWEILELAGLPIFRRNDVMESGRSDAAACTWSASALLPSVRVSSSVPVAVVSWDTIVCVS